MFLQKNLNSEAILAQLAAKSRWPFLPMSRAVLQVFEEYQKARVTFVQTVADLATRPQNIDALQNAGVSRVGG